MSMVDLNDAIDSYIANADAQKLYWVTHDPKTGAEKPLDLISVGTPDFVDF